MAVPNFPQPPGRNVSSGGKTFPSDLIASGREYYTQISFAEYSFAGATGLGGALAMGSSVKLPMPRKINDIEAIQWEEFSATSAITGAEAQTLAQVGSMASGALGKAISGAGVVTQAIVTGTNMAGIYTGNAVNPFMFMMFRRPGFKEYTLNWTLAPNSQKDSDNLRDIIKECKRAALPQGYDLFGGLMKYPKIALVSFKPDNYLFKIKPCAIISVAVDYTGANGPSFFKNGAPTVVNLSIQLKEMQLRDAQTAD